jgi:hypothetical protein
LENNTSHIDQFLNTKLKHLEQAPNKVSYDKIFNHLQHLNEHPDFFINSKLGEFESSPEQGAMNNILEKTNTTPPIDSLLSRQLKDLEAVPPKQAEKAILKAVERTSSKKYYLLLFLFLIGVGFIWLNNNNKNASKIEVNGIVTSTNLGSQKKLYETQNEEVTNKEIEKIIEKGRNLNLNTNTSKSLIPNQNKKTVSNSWKQFHESTGKSEFMLQELGVSTESIEIDEDIQQFYKLKNNLRLTNQYSVNTAEIRVLKRKNEWVKLSPFSFYLNIGIIGNNNISNNLKDNNSHKDEQAMINRSMGKNNLGLNIQLGSTYHLYKKASIRMGVQVSRVSSNKPINYIHTDVPVYDTTGKLVGYLTRPASASPKVNENVKQQQTQVAIPVSIAYQFLKTPKLNLSIGIGMQLGLLNRMKGKFYNFQTEQMEQLKSGFKSKFQGGLLLQMSAPINKQFSFDVLMQLNRSKDNYTLHEMQYYRINIIPNLQFGIRYTPYIYIK